MLDWKIPEITDGDWIRRITHESDAMGSDLSFANIYLLRDKYDIRIARCGDCLVRRYRGKGTRRGYTFPIGSGDIRLALKEIELTAQSENEPFTFTFVTEQQRDILDGLYPGRFEYTEDAGDYDYIYSRDDLANLSGKAYHKKKNHVSRFTREYPDYRYEELTAANAEDAAAVEACWYGEHSQDGDDSQRIEYRSIREALHHFDELKLSGGIIYVGSSPVAMTIASQINADTTDVHFEKSIGDYATNGGYAAINNHFAKSCGDAIWLNREEDINIEGLRKAKQSYHPRILLRKCQASERNGICTC